MRTDPRGFTLVELMVTITILVILASVAITSWTAHIRRAHANEATALLMHIKMQQEQYFSLNSVYVDTDGGNGEVGGLFPATAPDKFQRYHWTPMNCAAAAPGTSLKGWCDLGVAPSEPILFRAVTLGWSTGGDLPPPSAYPIVNNLDPNRRWYYAVAHADQDGDGVFSTFIVTNRNIPVIADKPTE